MQGLILTRANPDRCIRAFPMDAYQAQAALYLESPVTTQEGRSARRDFFGNSYPVELDKQGRVLLPGQLRTWANLEAQGSVVVLGTGEGFEIWNASDFESAQSSGEFRRVLD